MSQSLPEHELRSTPRRGAALTAKIWELGSRVQSATVADLGAGGCRLTECSLAIGADVWLRFGARDPIRARVAWVGATGTGCAFYRDLAFHEVGAIARGTAVRRSAALFGARR
jgi:hypothetical protein